MEEVMGNVYLRSEIYAHLPPENQLSFMRTCREFAKGLEKVHTRFLDLLLPRLAERMGTSLETAKEVHRRLMEYGCVYAGGLVCQLAEGTRYEDSDVDLFAFEPVPVYGWPRRFIHESRWDIGYPTDPTLMTDLIKTIDECAEKNLRPSSYASQEHKDLIPPPDDSGTRHLRYGVAYPGFVRRRTRFHPPGQSWSDVTEVSPVRGYSTKQYVEAPSHSDVLYFGPLIIKETDVINERASTPVSKSITAIASPARKVMDLVWLEREDPPRSIVSATLAAFDMGFCKVAYDGRRLHFASFESTVKKAGRYVPRTESTGRKKEERIAKYQKRGYTITDPEGNVRGPVDAKTLDDVDKK